MSVKERSEKDSGVQNRLKDAEKSSRIKEK